MKKLTMALVASALVFTPVYAKNQNGQGTSGDQGVGHSTGNQGNDKDVGNAGGGGNNGNNGGGSGGSGNSGGTGGSGGSGHGSAGMGGTGGAGVDSRKANTTGVCYKVDWTKRGPRVWRTNLLKCPKNYLPYPTNR